MKDSKDFFSIMGVSTENFKDIQEIYRKISFFCTWFSSIFNKLYKVATLCEW